MAGLKFTKGHYFAWGSSIYRADGDVEAWAGVLEGEAEEVVRFEDVCDPEVAEKMATAISADCTLLMIGSDTGIDEGFDEEGEDY